MSLAFGLVERVMVCGKVRQKIKGRVLVIARFPRFAVLGVSQVSQCKISQLLCFIG